MTEWTHILKTTEWTHALSEAPGQVAAVELALALASLLPLRIHLLGAMIRRFPLPLVMLPLPAPGRQATSRLQRSSCLTVGSGVACCALTPALAKPLNRLA
jgi:hypothetical protein